MLSQTPRDASPTQKPYNALSSSHKELDFKNPVKPLKNEEGASSSHNCVLLCAIATPSSFSTAHQLINHVFKTRLPLSHSKKHRIIPCMLRKPQHDASPSSIALKCFSSHIEPGLTCCNSEFDKEQIPTKSFEDSTFLLLLTQVESYKRIVNKIPEC